MAMFLILTIEEDYKLQITYCKDRKAFLRHNRTKVDMHDNKLTGRYAAAKFFGYNDALNAEYGHPDSHIYGELVFYGEYFDFECVSHEVAHAIIHKYRHAGVSPIDPEHEEAFCKAVGEISQNIMGWKELADDAQGFHCRTTWDSKL